MAENSKIGWTTHTHNPWIGCIKRSPACQFCYADAMVSRFGGDFAGVRKVTSENNWKQPLKWNREAEQFTSWSNWVRPRVFCASLADVFEDWQGPMLSHRKDSDGTAFRYYHFEGGWDEHRVSVNVSLPPVTMDDVRRRLFELIDATFNLDYLLLTKRPENIKSMWWGDLVTGFRPKSRKNVWLGTTVENQEYADKRIPELLKCRDLTPVLFLSVEPMLGPVDLRNIQVPSVGYKEGPDRSSDDLVDSLSGEVCSGETGCVIAEDQPTIDWVIVGCESGPKRRKTELSWVRSLRDQCQAAGTAFFVKQLEVDGKVTDNIEDFPEDLRIQEFPNATHSTTSKQASPRST